VWLAGCRTVADDPSSRAAELLEQSSQGKGDLVLACLPKDAEVAVDGVPRGLCSDFTHERRVQLGKGMHRVDVKREGYEPYQTFCEPSGTQATMAVSLRPLP
jgi:hypothetical protein